MKKVFILVIASVVVLLGFNAASAQYLTHNYVQTQEQYEKTLFGQPISLERNGEYRLGIKCTEGIHAILTVYLADNGKYVPVFSCPAVIGKNGPGKQAEGDSKTPLGTWVIGEAYGIKDDPGSLVPYTKVTEDMYWCATGNHSKKYNKLIYKSDEPNADYSEDEHLIDYHIVYEYFLDLGYNLAGAPYVGNAIFLSCWRSEDTPTSGSIGISEENIVKVLRMLPPGTVVTIY